ncbi:hypothetical protein GCM10022199_19260 [Marihabitans asiaticum]|uniref:hypothetical protein n=1 Tax=Marihabitans asiaticum TaxID=415218 RepID=UPI001FECADF8|nr:hypothetical protein [Marihabitans asiaticum]
MRIASAVLLLLVVLGAILAERENVGTYIAQVGLVTTLFCALSLTVGHLAPRVLGMSQPEAIASGFEIGIHNSTLAIAMAVTVLQVAEMAVPPAGYGIVMFFVAGAFGVLVTRGRRPADETA